VAHRQRASPGVQLPGTVAQITSCASLGAARKIAGSSRHADLSALADAKQVSLQSGESVYAASLSDGVNCMPVSFASRALASGALEPGSIVRVTDFFTVSGANKCAGLPAHRRRRFGGALPLAAEAGALAGT